MFQSFDILLLTLFCNERPLKQLSVSLLNFLFVDVLLGDYNGTPVAVKVLKDKTMVQQFLAEAYVMT